MITEGVPYICTDILDNVAVCRGASVSDCTQLCHRILRVLMRMITLFASDCSIFSHSYYQYTLLSAHPYDSLGRYRILPKINLFFRIIRFDILFAVLKSVKSCEFLSNYYGCHR